jgi:hypothetical protein
MEGQGLRGALRPMCGGDLAPCKRRCLCSLRDTGVSDLEIAVAIREGRYPIREEPVCAFSIGAAGETCRRCGATWEAHGRVTVALHRSPQATLADPGASA